MLNVEFTKELRELLSKYNVDDNIGLPNFVIANHIANYIDLIRDLGMTTNSYFNDDRSDDLEDVDPGEMDGDAQSAFSSIGWGTDEDYGGTDERY